MASLQGSYRFVCHNSVEINHQMTCSEDDMDEEEYFTPLSYCKVLMDDDGNSNYEETHNKISVTQNSLLREFRKIVPKLQEEGSVALSNNNTSTERHKNNRNKRKHACQFCGKIFGWTTDLKRHMLVHTGERPFSCPICNASFTRNFLLQKHKSKIHHCLTPHEISRLNRSVAENIMEIKAKMLELKDKKYSSVDLQKNFNNMKETEL